MSTLFLSDAQLTKFRADVAKMLPDTCAISSVSYASDGAGGNTETWSTVATVACRVDPVNTKGGGMEAAAMREALDTMYQLTVPYDTAIDVGNRITHNSIVYEIRQLSEQHSWRVSKRCLMARVD